MHDDTTPRPDPAASARRGWDWEQPEASRLRAFLPPPVYVPRHRAHPQLVLADSQD